MAEPLGKPCLKHIPELMGNDNFQLRNQELVKSLSEFGIINYIFEEDIPKLHQTSKLCFGVINRSTKLVGRRLAHAEPETAEYLVHGFRNLKPSDFQCTTTRRTVGLRIIRLEKSVDKYTLRLGYLKRRLDEVGCHLPDNYAVWHVVDAIKEYKLKLYRDLTQEVRTWEFLMDAIYWTDMKDNEESVQAGEQGQQGA